MGEPFSGEDARELATAIDKAVDRARDPATAGACRARAELFSRQATTEAYRALYAELL